MKVHFHFDRLTQVIDRMLSMQRAKIYPFNRADATVPQKLIGEDIRSDKEALAIFYFFACIYMRGGIVSSTAFKLLLKMRTEHPWMFQPKEVIKREISEVLEQIKKYIGWDSKNASLYWWLNAELLVKNWGGSALSIIKQTADYEDATHFYLNSIRKGAKMVNLDAKNLGFWGHQQKMVSMQVYFADWEKLYPRRFIYPGPVDFHNYRLFIATGAVTFEDLSTESVSFGEKISEPARRALVKYIHRRGVDPIDVADVMWLFSLLMCGESPHTQTKEVQPRKAPLFELHEIVEAWDIGKWASRKTLRLNRSCHVCAFNEICQYSIPAGPYYGKRGDSNEPGGKLVLRRRPQLDYFLKPEQIPKALINAPLEGEAFQDAFLYEGRLAAE